MRLLGSLPNNGKAQDIALKALSDDKPEARAAGAEALANMQAKSAIPQLEIDEQKKMLKDPNKLAQFGFEQGVGFIPFGGLTLGVFRTLTKDDVSPIRAAAAEVLAGDPDPKTTRALKTAVSDKSWIVRAAAADALGKRKDASVIPPLEPALDDEKEAVRYTAAVAIIRLNDIKNSKPAARPAAKRTAKPK